MLEWLRYWLSCNLLRVWQRLFSQYARVWWRLFCDTFKWVWKQFVLSYVILSVKTVVMSCVRLSVITDVLSNVILNVRTVVAKHVILTFLVLVMILHINIHVYLLTYVLVQLSAWLPNLPVFTQTERPQTDRQTNTSRQTDIRAPRCNTVIKPTNLWLLEIEISTRTKWRQPTNQGVYFYVTATVPIQGNV